MSSDRHRGVNRPPRPGRDAGSCFHFSDSGWTSHVFVYPGARVPSVRKIDYPAARSTVTDFQYVGDELDLFAEARNWKAYFASLIQPRIAGRVLEVGAGIGATTRALHSGSAVSWTCLEPDPLLASRIPTVVAGGSIDTIVGTTRTLGGSRQFDTILYIDVLEHIGDDRAELSMAARHLAPGGTIIVLSPAFQSLYSEFDKAIGHVRRYTKETLAAAFPESLCERDIFYADSVGALLSFANRVFLHSSLPTSRQIRTWDKWIIPASRIVDPLIGRRFGRSIVAVYALRTVRTNSR